MAPRDAMLAAPGVTAARGRDSVGRLRFAEGRQT